MGWLNSVRRLLAPLSYLRIKREGKIFDELILPLLLTAISLGCIAVIFKGVPVFTDKGLIGFIVGYLQIVSGFYIASLAAVATFDKPSMDDLMAGTPPQLKLRQRIEPEKLTRRRFLCYLFGYLSFLSLSLYFSGSLMILVAQSLKDMAAMIVQPYLKWGAVAAYLFVTFNMLVTTLLGLYYMADRIHRPVPVFKINPERQSKDKNAGHLNAEEDDDGE